MSSYVFSPVVQSMSMSCSVKFSHSPTKYSKIYGLLRRSKCSVAVNSNLVCCRHGAPLFGRHDVCTFDKMAGRHRHRHTHTHAHTFFAFTHMYNEHFNVHVHVNVYVYAYAYVYAYVYAHAHTHAYTHTHTPTHQTLYAISTDPHARVHTHKKPHVQLHAEAQVDNGYACTWTIQDMRVCRCAEEKKYTHTHLQM